jgi:hypothetical protein
MQVLPLHQPHLDVDFTKLDPGQNGSPQAA